MHLIESKGVKSECMKFGENSRQMPSVSTIFDEYCSFFLRGTMNSLPGTNKLAFTESGMRLLLYLIKNKPDTSYTRVIS